MKLKTHKIYFVKKDYTKRLNYKVGDISVADFVTLKQKLTQLLA